MKSALDVMKSKKFRLAILCIAVLGFLPALYLLIKLNLFNVRYEIYQDTGVYPVLYFESGIGGPFYDTKTFLLKEKQYHKLEKHVRSYSKTYPVSALERCPIEGDAADAGQLMAYFRALSGDAYVFQSWDGNTQGENYILLADGLQTQLSCGEHAYFSRFFCFGSQYYVFCYGRKEQDGSGASDLISVHPYTKELKPLDAFTMDLTKLGISLLNLEGGFAVCGDVVSFSYQKEGRFYTAFYDCKKDAFREMEKTYRPVTPLSTADGFYLTGRREDTFILEQVSPDGGQVSYAECKFPRDKLEFGTSRDFVYLRDGRLYGSAFCTQPELSIFYTYDVAANAWVNWWEVRQTSDPVLMDYKYVVMQDGEWYDLYPYTDSFV